MLTKNTSVKYSTKNVHFSKFKENLIFQGEDPKTRSTVHAA